jgi:hypothetical protein
MSGAAQGSAATVKLEEDKKAGGEPQKEQQPQQPALLEDDDEFEDFPVEGVSPLQRLAVRAPANQHASQTGRKRRAKCLAEMHICGRRAGTTMIKMKTFPSSSGMGFHQCSCCGADNS